MPKPTRPVNDCGALGRLCNNLWSVMWLCGSGSECARFVCVLLPIAELWYALGGLKFVQLLTDKRSRGEFHVQVSYVAAACGLGYFGLPGFCGQSH